MTHGVGPDGVPNLGYSSAILTTQKGRTQAGHACSSRILESGAAGSVTPGGGRALRLPACGFAGSAARRAAGGGRSLWRAREQRRRRL